MNRKRNILTHLALKAYVASPLWPRLVDRHLSRALALFWRYKTGSTLDLDNPRTLNEKIQWLKLHGPLDHWAELTDKVAMKQLLSRQSLADYLPATLAVWDSADAISFDHLPQAFAIKCSHDCGSTRLVVDKSKLSDSEKRRITHSLRSCMNRRYGYSTVEPHYLRIQPRVLAEEYIGLDDPDIVAGTPPVDYKFFCFNGHAELCLVCYDRRISRRKAVKDLYELRPWRPFREGLAPDMRQQPFVDMAPPLQLDTMIRLAETLSLGHPEVRVDLYCVADRVYIGELTFTASSGIMRSLSDETQLRLGLLTRISL